LYGFRVMFAVMAWFVKNSSIRCSGQAETRRFRALRGCAGRIDFGIFRATTIV